MASRSQLRFLVLLSLAVTFAIVGFTPAANAQRGDSGAISGYVFDQAGNPLRGVKLTAESPTQIGGRKVTYSNPEGAFRFPLLQPGTFQVKAEAPRLQTVVQDNIRVGLNAAAELNVVMEVASTQPQRIGVG
jgi:hypothetical protein